MPDTKPKMDFDALVTAIQQIHDQLAAQAGKAVNISLTLRNWLIGCYIVTAGVKVPNFAGLGVPS